MLFHAIIPAIFALALHSGQRVDSLQKIQSQEHAFSILLKAENFADGGVSVSGETPDEHYAVVYLVRQKAGKTHFRKLMESPNIHAKLYALCGLYYVDYKSFDHYVEQLKNSKLKYSHFSGCIIHESIVGGIIFSEVTGGPLIIMKNRQETIDQAMDRILGNREGSFQWDISRGGIPAEIMKLGSG